MCKLQKARTRRAVKSIKELDRGLAGQTAKEIGKRQHCSQTRGFLHGSLPKIEKYIKEFIKLVLLTSKRPNLDRSYILVMNNARKLKG